MPKPLQLRVTDYESDTVWRWVLEDAAGQFLADYEVELDPDDRTAEGFFDLPSFLESSRRVIKPQEDLLREAGAWIGELVFGSLAGKLAERLEPPATVIRVLIPENAKTLLRRPLELAHLPDGRPLAEAGVRFIYQRADAAEPGDAKPAAGLDEPQLRALAVFSLPHGQNPLNLRRERVELEALLGRISRVRNAAVELRVLQYGATRATLEAALEEGAGWDLIHLSGHGHEGQLVLESASGEADEIATDELAKLLQPVKKSLKLLTLSSCLSGAGSVAAAQREIGLDKPRREAKAAATNEETAAVGATEAAAVEGEAPIEIKEIPSLAEELSRSLDCAVLGMRYRVGDAFARDCVLELYKLLLEKGRALPEALQLALADVLDGDRYRMLPLSPITPILFGPRAADLRLMPPKRPGPPSFALRAVGLTHFPPPPEHFVGRLRPMLRASQALAPGSDQRGVLFYGMAGAGKTACALELAYRHERDRFQAMAWWKAPDEDQDVKDALLSCAQALETQLPGLALVGLIDDPQDFATRVVPMLKALMQDHAILIVLDNLESLLTNKNRWRDERWSAFLDALLDHRGDSRVVVTSRRRPADLKRHFGTGYSKRSLPHDPRPDAP